MRRRGVALASLALNLSVTVAVLVLLALGVGPRTGEYRTLTMLTGSMAPSFPVGSVVVVTPQPAAELRPGQVITFQAPIEDRRVMTHRVVAIDRSGPLPVITTKGDANAAADPWRATLQDATVWRARGAVPLLGTVVTTLREPFAQLVLTRLLPLGLLAWLLVGVWRPARPATRP